MGITGFLPLSTRPFQEPTSLNQPNNSADRSAVSSKRADSPALRHQNRFPSGIHPTLFGKMSLLEPKSREDLDEDDNNCNPVTDAKDLVKANKDILAQIRAAGADNKQQQAIIYNLARLYSDNIGINFDTEIMPHLGNQLFWVADYGVSPEKEEAEGYSLGMSTRDALRCLVDTKRTIKIAQGIHETVKDMQRNNPGRDLTAIDAGTGTGILAIYLAAYGVEKINAIEYNPHTYEATKKFIKQLGLQKKIHLIQGDATRLSKIDLHVRNVDILTSECLSTGLMDEPQYAIITNLSQFLAPHAKIMPSSAKLFFSLAHGDWSTIPKDQTDINAGRVPYLHDLSADILYDQVDSKKDMDIPKIIGYINIPYNEDGWERPNTLVMSTIFKMDDSSDHPVLFDGSKFLGARWAFRLEGEIPPHLTQIPVTVEYNAGRRSTFLKARYQDGKIIFGDHEIAASEKANERQENS